jgi:CDP-glucose 4,6-dehydratase
VRASYSDPASTYATNVMGTVNVLEAVRRTGDVPVSIVVTSDKCYANREWPWGYRENEAKGGHDPYSSSKACAELVTDAYRASFFPPGGHCRVATARAGNVIGGGDWGADRLLPDLIRGALAGTPVKIRRPSSVRPWQHVLDCLSGYLVLAQRLWDDPDLQGGWNFGPDASDQLAVEEVIRLLTDLWPTRVDVEIDRSDHPHEAGLLALDCTLARQRLGWHPRWSADQAVARVVEWYAVYRDGGDVRGVTMAQIRAREAATGARP